MGTAIHNFIDIFHSSFEVGERPVTPHKIVIPMIQRDYAQGRRNYTVNKIRERFLHALKSAVCETPVILDFIYGDIDEDGIMTPLDGQQRLTTLFLLHYYIAKKEKISKEESSFLEDFSYETRYSARDFCRFLVQEFEPSFTEKLSSEIENHAKFPLDWKKDPTICSMLTMLDGIDEVFADTSGVWQKLKDGAISFYFLPVKDMGLTDELYIKMNSRGKPLTQFEHFKAELEHELRKTDPAAAERIGAKIDREWTDMLWFYRSGTNPVTDDAFLRYFNYICAILYYESGRTMQGKSSDEFDLLKEFFSADCPDVKENIKTLESFFDCWCSLDGYSDPKAFFENFLSYTHEEHKIRQDQRYDLDVFHDCLEHNYEVSGRNRPFPLKRMVLLYAAITYLLNREHVTEKAFARRLRMVSNLINNSEDELSDSETRVNGNRIPAILKQVKSIVLTGQVDWSVEKSFNRYQLTEEEKKAEWVKEHPEQAENLFQLEDHPLLDGQIAIVGLDHMEDSKRFHSLFSCDYDKIDCALMSIGFYGQMETNKKRYQVGSGSPRNEDSWKSLFHRSNNVGFERTRAVLLSLLAKHETFSDEILTGITEAYIAECEAKSLFEWRYYYVRYPAFRPKRYGKLWWEDLANAPYELYVLQTRTNWSENTYQPFLKEIDEANLSRDNYGQYLYRDGAWYECSNHSLIKSHDVGEETVTDEELAVAQNENGIDTENRVELFRNVYNRHFVAKHIRERAGDAFAD